MVEKECVCCVDGSANAGQREVVQEQEQEQQEEGWKGEGEGKFDEGWGSGGRITRLSSSFMLKWLTKVKREKQQQKKQR